MVQRTLFIEYLWHAGAMCHALEMDGKDEQARFSTLKRPPVLGEEDRG